jgi:hypothetical protein
MNDVVMNSPNSKVRKKWESSFVINVQATVVFLTKPEKQ